MPSLEERLDRLIVVSQDQQGRLVALVQQTEAVLREVGLLGLAPVDRHAERRELVRLVKDGDDA